MVLVTRWVESYRLWDEQATEKSVTDTQTDPTTVTLAVHARRGLINMLASSHNYVHVHVVYTLGGCGFIDSVVVYGM